MARIYKILAPATFADGDPLDAWTARDRIQRNTEAVYEEARDDGRVILQAPMDIDRGISGTNFYGPMPLRCRLDRNGRWRTQYIDILYAPGKLDQRPVWAVLTETWRCPSLDSTGLAPAALNPHVEWSPASTTTLAWQGAKAIVPPRDWSPGFVERGDETERGRVRLAWLTVWTFDIPGGDRPRIAGHRHYEHVEDEP